MRFSCLQVEHKLGCESLNMGEAGVVSEGPDGKSGDSGIEMMFVGYPANRESDSVQMWDPTKNGVVTTRNVIWMKLMYFT